MSKFYLRFQSRKCSGDVNATQIADDTVDDYQYDSYGNMTSDQNKQITSITYNHLNLPKKVTFTGNYKYIEYVYDATGVKLKKLVSSMNSNNTVENATTEYLGGFQYTSVAGAGGLALQFFPNAEGYVKNTVINSTNNYNYVYNYTDHLGNIRLSYAYDDQTGNVQPLDEHHYYPFGLELVNILNTAKMEFKGEPYTYVEPSTGKTVTITKPMIVQVANSGYQYQYQGQERQDELNLNWDSFKYRNYDYAIGRFMSVDPLAEKYSYNGVYNFSENRVIDARELEGLEANILFGSERKAAENFGQQYNGKSIKQGVEYGTNIYKTVASDGNTYYYYEEPNKGKSDGVSLPFTLLNEGTRTATIHTHGRSTANDEIQYDDNNFSNDQKENKGDIPNAERRGKDSYVVTPDGSLKKYDVDSNKTRTVSTDMPSDPNDPGRKNNVEPVENPKPVKTEPIKPKEVPVNINRSGSGYGYGW